VYHCYGYTVFWSVQPLLLLLLTSLPPTSFFKSYQYNPYILYLHRSYVYDITDALAFAFPFPELHRVVPQLLTWSACEFVYDHDCFCAYVYLLDLSSTYERKHAAFVFLSLAYFT
jgi:hypothetical protein